MSNMMSYGTKFCEDTKSRIREYRAKQRKELHVYVGWLGMFRESSLGARLFQTKGKARENS